MRRSSRMSGAGGLVACASDKASGIFTSVKISTACLGRGAVTRTIECENENKKRPRHPRRGDEAGLPLVRVFKWC